MPGEVQLEARARAAGDDLPLLPSGPSDLVTGTTGISLSGGGIRAAAFGLGALQSLSRVGLVRGPKHATYLSAVSGGSYIAGALTMVAQGPFPSTGPATATQPSTAGTATVVAPSDPFARSSPEEQWVRNHLRYLVHGPRSLLTAVGRLLAGIVINLAVITIGLCLVGIPLGLVYGAVFPPLRRHSAQTISIAIASWCGPTAIGLVTAGALVGIVVVLKRFQADEARLRVARVAAVLLGAGALVGVLCIGLPELLVAIRNVPTTRHHANRAAASSTQVGVVTVVSLVGSVLTGLAALFARGSAVASSSAPVERWLRRTARSIWPRIRSLVLNLLATLFGPVLVAGILVLALSHAAAHARWSVAGVGVEAAALAVAVVVGLVMYAAGDLVEWSLHPLYKRRLADAFSLQRVRCPDGTEAAEERPYGQRYPMSGLTAPDIPDLLICAAVNVSDYGRTPTASDVGGFVFSPTRIGGPLVGELSTPEYEAAAAARSRDFTVPAAVSIAGAAISPSMGRMTRRPLRFLIALLNLRLGVWLPNPSVLAADARGRARPAGDGPAAAKARTALLAQKEEDLSALEKVRVPKPSVRYLVAELLGINRATDRYVYVSDGGHYENLGLVELIRRGCETVWCVDAAGDPIDAFSTVAEAIAIARSELGVDIDLRPEEMAPAEVSGPEARYVQHTHVVGTITYPSGKVGTLVFVKLGVPADAPTDVLTFHKRHPSFPCDPTLNQLFTADRFDAYRALGEFAMHRAVVTARRHDGTLVAP